MDTEQSGMYALLVAERLAERLDCGSVVLHPYGNDALDIPLSWLPRGIATARGCLNLSHQDIETGVSAEVHICVPHDWHFYSPNVRAFTAWVRRLPMGNPDWHFKRDKSLCYVLDPEWRDFIASTITLHGDSPRLTQQLNSASTTHDGFFINMSRPPAGISTNGIPRGKHGATAQGSMNIFERNERQRDEHRRESQR